MGIHFRDISSREQPPPPKKKKGVLSRHVTWRVMFQLQTWWRHQRPRPPVPTQRGHAFAALWTHLPRRPRNTSPILPSVKSAAQNQNSASFVGRDRLT
jgi:hypothetical protein